MTSHTELNATTQEKDATAILLHDTIKHCRTDGGPESGKESADIGSQLHHEIATLRRKLSDAEKLRAAEKAIWQKEKRDILEEKAILQKDLVEERATWQKEKKELVEENRRLAGSKKTLMDMNEDSLLLIAQYLDHLGGYKNKLALAEALEGSPLDRIIMGKPGSFFWKKLNFALDSYRIDLGIFMSSVLSRVDTLVEKLTLDTTCGGYRLRLAKEIAEKNDRKFEDVLRHAQFPRYYEGKLVKLFESMPGMPILQSLCLLPGGGSGFWGSLHAKILKILCAKLPPNLKTLTFSAKVNDEMLQVLTSSCPKLEETAVPYDDKSPQQNQWLLAFLNSKTQLKSVYLSPRFSPSVLSDWLQPGSEPTSRITHLKLRVARDDDMIHVPKLHSLTCLEVASADCRDDRDASREFSDASLPYIGQLNTLKQFRLTLDYPRITKHGLRTFLEDANFRLRKLHVSFQYPAIYDEDEEEEVEIPDIWSDEAVRALIKRNPELEVLFLHCSDPLSNEGFTEVNSLPKLSSLDLRLNLWGNHFSIATFLHSLQPEKLCRLSVCFVCAGICGATLLRTDVDHIQGKFPTCKFGFDRFEIIDVVPPIEFPDIDEDEGPLIGGNDIAQALDPELDGGVNYAEHDVIGPNDDEGRSDLSNTEGQDLRAAALNEWSDKQPMAEGEPLLDDSDSTNFDHNDPDGMENTAKFVVSKHEAEPVTTDEAINTGQKRGPAAELGTDDGLDEKPDDPISRGAGVLSELRVGTSTVAGPSRKCGTTTEELDANVKVDGASRQQNSSTHNMEAESESTASNDDALDIMTPQETQLYVLKA